MNLSIGNIQAAIATQGVSLQEAGLVAKPANNTAKIIHFAGSNQSVKDSVEISPEGEAALAEAQREEKIAPEVDEEKNYGTLISDMAKRLKDIFNALIAWSQEIIQNAMGNNKNNETNSIVENIKNSSVPLAEGEDETDHKEEFKAALGKYFDSFKEAMTTVYESVKENVDALDEELGKQLDELMTQMSDLLGEMTEMLDEFNAHEIDPLQEPDALIEMAEKAAADVAQFVSAAAELKEELEKLVDKLEALLNEMTEEFGKANEHKLNIFKGMVEQFEEMAKEAHKKFEELTSSRDQQNGAGAMNVPSSQTDVSGMSEDIYA